MLDSFMSLLALATIALAAYGLGRPLLRGLGIGQLEPLAVAVWSIAVGLATAGLVLAGLGTAGLLYRPLVGALTLAAGFWGIGELWRAWMVRSQASQVHTRAPVCDAETPGRSWQRTWLLVSLAALTMAAAAGSLLAALAPPTAGDALCYHLELPKRFLLEHSLLYLPDSDNCTYPLLVEMLYLWALALDGPVAAQLVHWGCGILLALATVLLAVPIVGRPWSWCSGCLVLLVPGVSNQMTAPLNDVGLALFTTLFLAAWWRAVYLDEGRQWFLVAGVMLGGALAAKYLALVFLVSVLLAAAPLLWRPEMRRLLAGSAAMLTVAASLAGIWYLRAAWHRGNPVYPFFEPLGGAAPPTWRDSKLPLGRNPLALAAAPWYVTMHPDRFGGRGHQLGPLFLATLPGLLICRRLRGLGTTLAICAVYLGIWFCMRQNIRFLLPLVPLACVAVVWLWMEMRRLPRLPTMIIAATTASILLATGAAAVVRARTKAEVAIGLTDSNDFLLRHEPSYRAALWANALLSEGDHILSQEHRAFYFDARVTRENLYRRRTRYDQAIPSGRSLSRHLRHEGFTHVLLAESTGGGIHFNPTLSRLVDAQDPEGLACLFEYRFNDSDGATRRYRLIELR